ncbi:DUF4123 domain-containing protein [Pseudomonas resinovorans]|uniref:DUF4123 domain-containing protein n=1 Tax=Metapseudomonas resinovorans TaxID=53412 RepID=A0ABT4YDN4_METRE|nr:DUF4123 domain-containing protein [Pseudomonas resinovorans]MDA8486896.1 DUF4123 domain-containing protein [Pseudomonas resinovorans]
MSRPAFPPLPDGLPWSIGAYLLMDGVSVKELPRQLKAWGVSTLHKPLYEDTRWSALIDLSPYLVELTGPDDPVLQQFLLQGQADWGLLLLGGGHWQANLHHLRWLTSVLHPQGQEMLLRLADSSVADALLGKASATGDTTLFGPFSEVVIFETDSELWVRHRRPEGAVPAPAEEPYRLNEDDLERLGKVRLGQVLTELAQYLRSAFPEYGKEWAPAQYRARLNDLADQAYAKGFCSEADLTLYVTLFALLGDQVLNAYPTIAELLEDRNELTPSQRLQQATDLAYAYALQTRSVS